MCKKIHKKVNSFKSKLKVHQGITLEIMNGDEIDRKLEDKIFIKE